MKNNAMKYGFAAVTIIAGLIFSYFHIGERPDIVFGSLGAWLIYVGFITLAIMAVRAIGKNKEKKVDERMEFVAAKAGRVTFVFIIIAAFAVMIADGIKPIAISYYMFMAYMISAIVFVYFVAYKVLLRYN